MGIEWDFNLLVFVVWMDFLNFRLCVCTIRFFLNFRFKFIDKISFIYLKYWLFLFYGVSTLFGSFNADLLIGLEGRVLTNGPEDLGSIPGQVLPKTLNMILDTSLLCTQHYKVRIKGKVEQSSKVVVPSPIPRCSSNWKGSPRVLLDYSNQLYLLSLA